MYLEIILLMATRNPVVWSPVEGGKGSWNPIIYDVFYHHPNGRWLVVTLGISGWTISSMKGAFYRLNIRDFSRCWFQTFFIFIPTWGRWTHFDEHIFQMGGKKPPTSFGWFQDPPPLPSTKKPGRIEKSELLSELALQLTDDGVVKKPMTLELDHLLAGVAPEKPRKSPSVVGCLLNLYRPYGESRSFFLMLVFLTQKFIIILIILIIFQLSISHFFLYHFLFLFIFSFLHFTHTLTLWAFSYLFSVFRSLLFFTQRDLVSTP